MNETLHSLIMEMIFRSNEIQCIGISFSGCGSDKTNDLSEEDKQQIIEVLNATDAKEAEEPKEYYYGGRTGRLWNAKITI